MPVYQIDGLTPVVPDESYVHPTAVLIGDVILGKGVYVGPNASLRGDFGRIVVKDGANIQDNCVMHGFPEQDTVVEEDGHIGHSAILHGCIIRRNALVGMNAVVMDGAVIGENSIVGAAAFVKAKAEMPANHLIIGSPAKAIRVLSEQEIAWKKQGTREYQVLVDRCKLTLHQVEPCAKWSPVENVWSLTRICDQNRRHEGARICGSKAAHRKRPRQGPVHVYAGLMRCAKSEPVLQTGGNGIVFVGNARRITAN